MKFSLLAYLKLNKYVCPLIYTVSFFLFLSNIVSFYFYFHVKDTLDKSRDIVSTDE